MAGRLVGIVSVMALAAALSTPAVAQARCRPTDSTALAFLAHIARHAAADSGADAAVRESLRLRYTPREQVVLSQDERLCKQASLAYRKEFYYRCRDAYWQGVCCSGWGSVCRLGRRLPYGPRRPNVRHGTNWIIAIFDKQWRRLSLF